MIIALAPVGLGFIALWVSAPRPRGSPDRARHGFAGPSERWRCGTLSGFHGQLSRAGAVATPTLPTDGPSCALERARPRRARRAHLAFGRGAKPLARLRAAVL